MKKYYNKRKMRKILLLELKDGLSAKNYFSSGTTKIKKNME